MMPHSNFGWNQQTWLPVPGNVGFQGIPNINSFHAQIQPQNWNSGNQWQQWNFQASWNNPSFPQPPPPPIPQAPPPEPVPQHLLPHQQGSQHQQGLLYQNGPPHQYGPPQQHSPQQKFGPHHQQAPPLPHIPQHQNVPLPQHQHVPPPQHQHVPPPQHQHVPPPQQTIPAPQAVPAPHAVPAQHAPPPPPQENSSLAGISDTEQDFDFQFNEWEAKFLAWKEENKNHPDKKALSEYEAQWNVWRQHLLQNREQLRKQREEILRQQLFSTQSNELEPLANPRLPAISSAAKQNNFQDRSVNEKVALSNSSYSDDQAIKRVHQGYVQNDQNSSNSLFEPLIDPLETAETGANLFRKRANRGRSHIPARGSPPYNLTSHREDTYRDYQENRLPSSERNFHEKIFDSDFNPSFHDPFRPPVQEPVIYEYFHQATATTHGRYSELQTQVKSFDYSHGYWVDMNTDAEHRMSTCIPGNRENRRTFEKSSEMSVTKIGKSQNQENPKDNPIKQPLLFPSAASIQEDSSNQKLTVGKEPTQGHSLLQSNSVEPTKTEPVLAVETVMVEDLLLPPGRYGRPSKIVVILRGLPGSGKSHLTRLIKEKEVTMGGSAPRILSIDDYYLMDESGPVWNEEQERQYKLNLLKSFKRNLEDGHFSFIIVDTLNLKASDLMDLSEPARLRGFAVFLVDLPERGTPGTTRHCTEKDIEKMKRDWQQAPANLPRLDIRWLLQESVTEERNTTPDDVVTSTTALLDEDSQGSSTTTPVVSKWETIELNEEKLDRLDGIAKRKLENPASLEDWLQLPDDYDQRKSTDGKKRVRWADVEMNIQQKKMRDLGFVVGHTDWSQMTDPSLGQSALTKTKLGECKCILPKTFYDGQCLTQSDNFCWTWSSKLTLKCCARFPEIAPLNILNFPPSS